MREGNQPETPIQNPQIPHEVDAMPVFQLTATFGFTVAFFPEHVVVERTFRVTANTVEEAWLRLPAIAEAFFEGVEDGVEGATILDFKVLLKHEAERQAVT